MKQFSHNTKMKFIAGSNLLPIETNETFHIHSFSTSQVDFIFLKENADIKDEFVFLRKTASEIVEHNETILNMAFIMLDGKTFPVDQFDIQIINIHKNQNQIIKKQYFSFKGYNNDLTFTTLRFEHNQYFNIITDKDSSLNNE